MDVRSVYDDGLCMQCGTCVGVCPTDAVRLDWDLRLGHRLSVDDRACTDCGACVRACPGPGIDFTAGAWWRGRNDGARSRDFLGPWRGLFFGWAADATVRHAGASGGVATALLDAALRSGFADAVLAVGADPANPLAAVGTVCRTSGELAACRGSRYNVVATNTLLRRVFDEPARYVLVGLPCHIQGLRLAQRSLRRLRERVVLALGIFCGLTCQPRATEVAALEAGLEPHQLASVAYRGPGWPGGMRLETRDGHVRHRPYPDYFDRFLWAHVPPRCRLCPDALAELADVSIGDAWLERFEGSDGVSDLIVRTPAGERFMRGHDGALELIETGPDEMVASQRDTYAVKRPVLRGRLWLRRRAGRPAPAYPGLDLEAGARDRIDGALDAGRELFARRLADRRYPSRW